MTKVQELRNVETQVKELLDELELKESIESTVKEQLRGLSNFYRISESLTTGGNITTILDEICNLVSCIRGVDGAWIGLAADNGESIVPAANRKVPSELLRPHSIDEPDSPVTEAIEMGKVTIIDSCEEPERFGKWCSRISGAGYDSAAVFPLTFGDTITGVMVVLSCGQEYFVPQTLPLFQMYANQASSAVRAAQLDEHIRLYRQKASFHEKEYRLFLERLSEAVFILDTALSCTYCNRSFELLAKKEIEDIAGKKITPYFRKNDSQRIRSALNLCLDGTNSRFVSVTPGGEKNLEVDLNPVRAEDGTVIGIIGVARDISEMERAAKLDESVEELNQEIAQRAWMIDNSPTGVLMIEPDGTIVQLNAAGAKLLNSTVKKCIGTPIYSFFPEKERGALASAIATALHSGESRAESVISTDGDEKSLSLRCRRRRAESVDLIAVYLSDVNEQAIIRENLANISTRV